MSAEGQKAIQRGIAKAKQQGYNPTNEGWQTPNGKVLPEAVDPLPIQEEVIKHGFRQASEQGDFDVWTVVNKEYALKEGRPLAENFQAVFDQWSEKVNKPGMIQAVKEAMDIDDAEE